MWHTRSDPKTSLLYGETEVTATTPTIPGTDIPAFLDGDRVSIDSDSRWTLDSRVDRIVGVIELTSKVVFPDPKRRGFFKRFRPQHPRHPPFLVRCKTAQAARNRYAVIAPDRYDDRFRSYVGHILDYLGEVGDQEADHRYLVESRGFRWKKPPKFELLDDADAAHRRDLTDLETISIDPEGSRDLDDLISYRSTDRGFELGVHIADVASYLDPALDPIWLSRGTSAYWEHTTQHMLPEEVSTGVCSLLEGVPRRAISVLIEIVDDSVVGSEIVKSTVVNKKQSTYDEIDETHPLFHRLKSFSPPSPDGAYDSHEMVAAAMITANRTVAEWLQKQDPKSTLFRNHRGYLGPKHDGPINRLIERFRSTAAEYRFEENLGHVGLNAPAYVHFTSPIRRFADLMVHRVITAHLRGDTPSWPAPRAEIAARLNRITRQARRAKIEEKMLSYVHKSPGITRSITVEVVGFDRRRLIVLIRSLDMLSMMPSYSYHLSHLVTETVEGDTLTLSGQGEKFEFRLGEQFEAVLTTDPSADRIELKFRLTPVQSITKRFLFASSEPIS